MSHNGPHDYPHAFSPPARKRPPALRARIREAVSVAGVVDAAITVLGCALGAVTLVAAGAQAVQAAAGALGIGP